jgi:hypothetical protein
MPPVAQIARGKTAEDTEMNTVVGIFNSFADAKRAVAMLRALGIADNQIGLLSPRTPEIEIEANIPTTETEQPGVGTAVGGAVGGALGVAGGMHAGLAVATALIPGVGPVFAIGLISAALFGIGGAAAGAAAGNAIDDNIDEGLPRDELYLYEDSLRRGRSVVIALAGAEEIAERARTELQRAGAESIDAAREQWWIGLRDAEQEHYSSQGGNFNVDEAAYRLGFEAALHPDRRGRSYENTVETLRTRYADNCALEGFRRGYERGQAYQRAVENQSNRKNGESGCVMTSRN